VRKLGAQGASTSAPVGRQLDVVCTGHDAGQVAIRECGAAARGHASLLRKQVGRLSIRDTRVSPINCGEESVNGHATRVAFRLENKSNCPQANHKQAALLCSTSTCKGSRPSGTCPQKGTGIRWSAPQPRHGQHHVQPLVLVVLAVHAHTHARTHTHAGKAVKVSQCVLPPTGQREREGVSKGSRDHCLGLIPTGAP